MEQLLLYAVLGLYGTVIGVIYWVNRSRNELVYKDVCKSERKRIDDCIEGAVERSEQRYAELKSDMLRGFEEIKELIRNQKRKE